MASLWKNISAWVSHHLATSNSDLETRSDKTLRARWAVVICSIVFFLAIGVRFLHWQDLNAQNPQDDSLSVSVSRHYHREARRMSEQGGVLFPREAPEHGDARMIVHPPGYSILMMLLNGLSSDLTATLRFVQIVSDAAAAVLVVLIAGCLVPRGPAIIAGFLVALSPHLAYYSLWLTPESLAVLPLLLATYLIIRATRRPGISTMAMAGALVGLSCWLRSNGLLLAFFLAALVWIIFKSRRRLTYSISLVAAMLIVISPITVRNWTVFRYFIPLSLGAGITFVEGIADYDEEGRFGMPADDRTAAEKDSEWHGRPDYAGNLWSPDGVPRDRFRIARGLEVVRSDPGWFFAVMLQRAAFMLRYNDARPHKWPFNTAIVPVVSGEPPFGSWSAITDEPQAVWSGPPALLIADGEVLSPGANVSLSGDSHAVEVAGDGSAYGDQFAFPPIAVRRDTDYMGLVTLNFRQGRTAAKITSADRRVALASIIIPPMEERTKRRAGNETERLAHSTEDQNVDKLRLPFASGRNESVRLVLSNDGEQSARPIIQVSGAEILKIGPTPHVHTSYPRVVIRMLQKRLFTTSRMGPLILIGIVLLVAAGRLRALSLILAVPLYYLCIQSALHTEYRYILAIHYFLFVMAAVAIYCIVLAVGRGVRRGYGYLRRGSAVTASW